MAFWQYRPFSIRFPEESPLRRMMVASEPSADGPPWPTAAEAAQFDDRTLFWDIRWDAETELFECYGPPQENLGSILTDVSLTVTHAGQKLIEGLPLQVTQTGPNVLKYTATNPVTIDPEAPTHISAWARDIPLGETPLHGHRRRIGSVFVATLQINSDPELLCDWLDYLNWHGIDGAAIYDNGSQNHAAIRERLQSRKSNQKVMLIGWPMQSGPPRFPRLCYGRDGHLTHAARWYQLSDWMVSLDVGEYPVVPDGTRLVDTLNEQRDKLGALRLTGRRLFAPAEAEVTTPRDLTLAQISPAEQTRMAVRPQAVRAISRDEIGLQRGMSETTLRPGAACFLDASPLHKADNLGKTVPRAERSDDVAPESGLKDSFDRLDSKATKS